MILEPRTVALTTRHGTTVERLLPQAQLRRIGAWVFADLFGPLQSDAPMSVAAHPHTGLQTATWLFAGAVEHNDSLGSCKTIVPKQLNLMTAGHGISHSELQVAADQALHAIQLWIALPEESRNAPASFDHYADLPNVALPGLSATVFVGSFLGHNAPSKVHSPLVGAELNIESNSKIEFSLNPEFEHGFIAIEGSAIVNSESLDAKQLAYVSDGASKVEIETGETAAKIIYLGGQPFTEPLVMWWNFIARSHDEIVQMRSEWEANSSRFGNVAGELSSKIPAPELPPIQLKAR
jgi:redox-sensitive bicupin YhaK (pirin superfamily)